MYRLPVVLLFSGPPGAVGGNMRSVGRSVGWSVGRLVGRSVGRSVHRSTHGRETGRGVVVKVL